MKKNILTRGNPYKVYKDGNSDQAVIIRACDPRGALSRFFQSSFMQTNISPYRGLDPTTAKFWTVKFYLKLNFEFNTKIYIVSYTQDKRARNYKIKPLFF